MKSLVMTLLDDKKYTFTTLSFTQNRALAKKLRGNKNLERILILSKKEDKEGLSEEEMLELLKISEPVESETDAANLKIVRLSLIKKHPEFAYQNDSAKDAAIDEKLMGLVDAATLNLVSSFAMSGMIPKQSPAEVPEEVIDLTKNSK